MPRRLDPFLTGNIYHLFDKTFDSQQVFKSFSIRNYFLNLMRYYRSSEAHIGYSNLSRLKSETYQELLSQISLRKNFLVDIISFSIMKNHYHILVRQLKDDGINLFMPRFLNSFTRYYNVKHTRKGPIFLPQFRSVCVTKDEQFIHTTRYIHRNHLESGEVSSKEDLIKYPWTSLQEYVENPKFRITNDKLILDMFDGNVTNYLDFVFKKEVDNIISENLQTTFGWLY